MELFIYDDWMMGNKWNYLMKLQFSDCKLNHSLENQLHSSLLKDTSRKVIMWIAVLALQVSFTTKFIVIPQHLKILSFSNKE